MRSPLNEARIVARFRASLQERLAQIDAALQAFEVGELAVQQRQSAIVEAHQLTGTLGMFGASCASSDLMKAIERGLEDCKQVRDPISIAWARSPEIWQHSLQSEESIADTG